ncbi:MAG: hypothetical protein ACP6IU_12725 [Candidatus Asgardarchaeia archaeon]
MERGILEALQKKAMTCFSFSDGIPVLPFVIKTPVGKRYPTKNSALAEIDTGYDGNILIPESTYLKLKLNRFELPEDEQIVIETAAGHYIFTRAALATVIIPKTGLKIRTTIETFENCKETLIGKGILQRLILLLYYPQENSCIFE